MGIDKKKYVIRISEDATIQLILNALEAHSVFHPGKQRAQTCLETYGLLWGHEIRHPTNNIIYSIELISIDTSAERTGNSVDPNDLSLKLKRELMTSFWPFYEFLGDVHTHPYKKNYASVHEKKSYNYSRDDFKRLEDNSPYWGEHNYRVGLVLTIARMDRAGTKKHHYRQENMIEFTLDKYRLWLKGYVLYNENEDGEEEKVLKVTEDNAGNVVLDCPSLVGQKSIFQFSVGE